MIINGRFLTQRVTGVQRFASEILRASSEIGLLNAKNAEILVPGADTVAPESFAGLPVRQLGTRKGHLWEQLELARAADGQPLINLCNTGPLFVKRQMVVLHDAAVAATPHNFTLAFRAWYKAMIRTYGHRATKIGTVSAFSADEIVKHFGISRAKIEIIPESGEHILRAPPDYSLHEKHGLESDRYFLAVSSHAPNKNFAAILAAVARLPALPFTFVIAGGNNAKIFNGIRGAITNAVETGYVSDGQLRALYERAACFVYPSLYEGFGIPPLEAMSCGCPVLASNAASLPEVCGTGVAYCDPHDVDDIARQLSLLLGSQEARAELRIAGRKRASQWTWNAAAQRLSHIKTMLEL